MADSGKRIEDLETRVNPASHLRFQWAAFADLSTDRQSGFGIGQIPWTSIDRYARRYGIEDEDEFGRFRNLLRAMDRVFIDWHGEK